MLFGFWRKYNKCRHIGRRLHPPFERLIDGYDPVKLFGLEWESICFDSIQFIMGTNLNLFKIIQDIHLRDDQFIHSIEAYGVIQSDQIQPSASPGPACCGSKLLTVVAELLSITILQFSRE